MNAQQIETVQATIPVLRENGVALTSYFYKRMLTNHPELKNTFNLSHQETGRQPRALAAAVLAYAENIEDPSRLLKAVDRIAIKHVSLNIHPDQYAIVGDNLLHSISEVLELPMDHDVITAWAQAYGQLADILIGREKQIYATLASQIGAWTGWREFKIKDKQADNEQTLITLIAADGQAITTTQDKDFISVKVVVPEQQLTQPLQFDVSQDHAQHYVIAVKAEHELEGIPNVANILLNNMHIGDSVELTAPLHYSLNC